MEWRGKAPDFTFEHVQRELSKVTTELENEVSPTMKMRWTETGPRKSPYDRHQWLQRKKMVLVKLQLCMKQLLQWLHMPTPQIWMTNKILRA